MQLSASLAKFAKYLYRRRRCRFFAALIAVSATAALAQAPVEESQASPRSNEPEAEQVGEVFPADGGLEDGEGSGGESGGGEGGIGALYYQLQVLQDDVRRLQGLVEEQHHRIERLTKEQRERYIELDQRLLDVAGSPEAGSGTLDVPAELAPGDSEREVYAAAFAIVKNAAGLVPSEREAAYQDAIARFEVQIANFPNGVLVANAFYWIGEIHLYTDELELARQAFAQVVNLYGDDAKVPDSLYKLGVVYHRLGDNDRSLQYLDRVINEHGEHTAADLARSYAAELR